MEIRFSIDFGQGYGASLTIEDARRLYETLKEVFEPKESLVKAQERIIKDLRDKGYEFYTASGTTLKAESPKTGTEVMGRVHDIATAHADFVDRLDKAMDKVANGLSQVEDKASPTEAPGTLRDLGNHGHACPCDTCWPL